MKSLLPTLIGIIIFAAAVGAGCGSASPIQPTLPVQETVVQQIQPPQTAPQAAVNFPPSSSIDPIALAWFYHAPAEGVDPAVLAEYFDIFISNHSLSAGRDQLKALGAKGPFLQYIVMNEIIQPPACSDEPANGQVAYKAGDYCAIDKLHPDWFLSANDGQRIHDEAPYENNWFMDPSNEGWRKFWIERMLERGKAGWDGIFIDNLEVRPRFEDKPFQTMPDLASFQKANLEFMASIYEAMHSQGIKVYANILNVTSQEEWQLYLPYLDGAMLENFAVDWKKDEYLSTKNWEMQMQNVLATQVMGKDIILVAQGGADDFDRQVFALASYLLVNNGRAYFRYTDGAYDKLLMFPNYLDEPGRPLGERFYENGMWKRNFEHGQVTVDPGNHQATIDFTH